MSALDSNGYMETTPIDGLAITLTIGTGAIKCRTLRAEEACPMTKQLLDKLLALLYEERKALPPVIAGKPYISSVPMELGALRAACEIISADDCYSDALPENRGPAQ
jgi:hypothetical protein